MKLRIRNLFYWVKSIDKKPILNKDKDYRESVLDNLSEKYIPIDTTESKPKYFNIGDFRKTSILEFIKWKEDNYYMIVSSRYVRRYEALSDKNILLTREQLFDKYLESLKHKRE